MNVDFIKHEHRLNVKCLQKSTALRKWVIKFYFSLKLVFNFYGLAVNKAQQKKLSMEPSKTVFLKNKGISYH